MIKRIQKYAGAFLFAGFSLMASTSHAQSTPHPLQQQGKGAYMEKGVTNLCIPNSLLNLSNLGDANCLPMTRTKFLSTPSGNSQAIWTGTVPVGSRPAQQTTFNSTMVEATEGPTKGMVYSTVAVTKPTGEVTLTFTSKGNKSGQSKGKK